MEDLAPIAAADPLVVPAANAEAPRIEKAKTIEATSFLIKLFLSISVINFQQAKGTTR